MVDIIIMKATFEDYKICRDIGLENYQLYIKKNREWIASHLFKSYFKVTNFEKRKQSNVEIYIAKNKEVIVGFFEVEKYSNLSSIYVKKEYHHQGIGTALLNKAELLCLEKADSDKLNLDASDYAIDFYLKRGYDKVGKTKRVLGVNMTPMAKNLK